MFLARKDQELAGMLSLERDQDTLTFYGGLGAVSPKHRGAKLANIAPALLEAMGRAMGMGLVYYLATMRIPQVQAAAETAGFRLVGILPASDRIMVAPGVVKHAYEAIYAKVLAADADLLRPQTRVPHTESQGALRFPVLRVNARGSQQGRIAPERNAREPIRGNARARCQG